MSDTSQATFVDKVFDRQRLQRIADGLVVAIAVSLPWSISATAILIALWSIAFLSTFDLAALRRTLALPAAGLPVLLGVLAVLGMIWADVALDDRWDSLKAFLRLSVFVPLMIQFQRSDGGWWVLAGFAVSCTVLLAFSWAQWFVPALDWRRPAPGVMPGVPVKDYIIQSGEFLICAFALGHLSVDAWVRGRRGSAISLGLLALFFLANIAFVAAARSVLVIFAVLTIVFGIQRFGSRGLLGIALLVAVLSAAAWTTSSYLRARVLNVFQEVIDYHAKQAETSAGYRLEFWRKSITIISDAPIFGHGTGSLHKQFSRVATEGSVISSAVTDNPHNQTLIVGIQLGLIGVAILYAMWMAHLLLFRGGGLVPWVGSGLVVHGIGAGIFSSQLFEANLGWVYIFGVGVLGGMALRSRGMMALPEGAAAVPPRT